MKIENIEFEEINRETIFTRNPILSIWCNTYNHEKYIKDCLNGILSQKTEYEYEVVIFDDASTDGTTDVVRKYCEKYPYIFHAIIAKENTYNKTNRNTIVTQMIKDNMRGEYVAICEGDDYWCDCNKIQMQLDFLIDNPEYMLSMHNAKRVNYLSQEIDLMKSDEPSHIIEPEELIEQKSGIWPTASMVGKKEVLICEPFFFECGIGDWPMQLYAIAKGKVYYFNNVMSTYRYMVPNSWSARTTNGDLTGIIHSMKMVDFLFCYDNYTERKFHDYIVARINDFYYSNIFVNDDILIDNKNNLQDENDYFDNLIKLKHQLEDNQYISEDVKKFVGCNKKIYIMGKGKYASIIAKQISFNNIKISGYVLSDMHALGETDVIPLSKYKDISANSRLIIGIGPRYYIDILNNLREHKIENYIFPFVVYGERWET